MRVADRRWAWSSALAYCASGGCVVARHLRKHALPCERRGCRLFHRFSALDARWRTLAHLPAVRQPTRRPVMHFVVRWAQQSVIARRSSQGVRRLSVEDWKRLHGAIKKVFGCDLAWPSNTGTRFTRSQGISVSRTRAPPVRAILRHCERRTHAILRDYPECNTLAKLLEVMEAHLDTEFVEDSY